MQKPTDEGSVFVSESGFVGLGVVAFGHGFKPNGLVVRNIGFDGNVRHGMLGAGAVPVLDVRSNLCLLYTSDAADE